MATLPAWIADWVQDCCGEPRRVGERTELLLTFYGEVTAASGPDSVRALDDGKARPQLRSPSPTSSSFYASH